MEFLVETALLTHGLRSVSQEYLRHTWPFRDAFLVWVDHGRIIRGTMEEFLPFRAKSAELSRIDCNTLECALQSGFSGALTASGTMAVCERMGISLAVTCGMGGIGEIHGEELCPDLPALAQFPVALISTSPKDMLDIPETLRWLSAHGVHVIGAPCSGYVFCNAAAPTEAPLSACRAESDLRGFLADGGLLMLNPIPDNRRIQDLSILAAAVAKGKQAEACGGYYHPAVNAEIDRQTNGDSSRIQLASLIANIHLASSF